jgi:16S rRNA (cytidine1402-2'-O)-methyltransferase
MLREVLAVNHPAVVYESKYRIAKLLEELAEVYPDGLELMIARELTKMFESCYFGTPQELRQRLLSDPGMAKGEFVVLIRKRPVKKK